jgi:hypothetical protein
MAKSKRPLEVGSVIEEPLYGKDSTDNVAFSS